METFPITLQTMCTWGVDNLADLATDSRLGADGAYSNTNCFVDGLHPAVGCKPYITTIMQDAVNELLGYTAAKPNTTAAAFYQELAGDRFLTLTSSSPQSIVLPSCIGYSLSRQITNSGSAAASLATLNGETLTGSSSIATGMQAIFSPVTGSVTTGGCTWFRSQ